MISREPPVPVLHPLNLQRWSNMTFVHWPCDAAILAPALPKGLAVDTCEGSPWVSMLPFVVEDLRSPFLPALPWLSTFPELNLRTYVRGPDNEPGIWFYSLDAARLPAVIGARLTYGLPYFWAKMRILHQPNGFHYLIKRRGSQARADIQVEVGDPYAPEALHDLDHFLTARFRLYTQYSGRLAYAQVEHPAWPLQRAKILHLKETVRQTHGLPSTGELLAHYSPGVDVRISRLHFM